VGRLRADLEAWTRFNGGVVKHFVIVGLLCATPLMASAEPLTVGAPASVDVAQVAAQASVESDPVDVTQNISDQIDAYLLKSGLRRAKFTMILRFYKERLSFLFRLRTPIGQCNVRLLMTTRSSKRRPTT
jgi:hypothetical protein